MVSVNQQIIEVVYKFTDRGRQKIRQVNQQIQQLGGGYEKVTNTTRALNARTGRLTKTLETQRVVAKRFQMQWLSIMFFGMALQRMFSGLIRTSLEWTGVTEIMSLALGILFLPLAEKLLDWAILFLDAVSKLSPAQKKWIGWLVLTAVVAGLLLMGLGQLALGLAGMKWLVGAAGIKGFATAAAAATTKISLLKLALKGIIIGAGITIAWLGFKFMKKGIEEGSILKEIGGIIGFGLGIGAIGLTIGGPWGAGIGFVLGVTAAIIMDVVMGGKVGTKIKNVLRGFKEHFTGPQIPSLEFQRGGIVPGGLGNPVPILAHGGERIIPAGRSMGASENIIINATYNVTVADKREFESMLRENNIRLTEDVRRLVKT